MKIEPFELQGKTIRDAFRSDGELFLEFTDNSLVRISVNMEEDEITGNSFPVKEITIDK